MVALDEDALICDFAETYGVFDYRSLPANLAATFAVGLRESSRIKTKMNGLSCPLDEFLLAGIYDGINWLVWSKTEDGLKGRNRPNKISELFLPQDEKQTKQSTEYEVFDSVDEFEKAYNGLIGD